MVAGTAGVMDKDDGDLCAAQLEEPGEDFLPFDGFIFVDAADQGGEVVQQQDVEALLFTEVDDVGLKSGI